VSGRVVLAFTVLLVAFGGLAVYSTVKMRQLGREFALIRVAHLESSLTFGQLQAVQANFIDSLDSQQNIAPSFLRKYPELRRKYLGALQEQVAALDEIPSKYVEDVAQLRKRIVTLEDLYAAEDPIFVRLTSPDLSPEARRAAREELVKAERDIQRKVTLYFKSVRSAAARLMGELQQEEERSSLWALAYGVLAVALGVVVIAGAILTLRPLAQLRDGVRRVARGDYRDRLGVKGATEIAELASDFNAMAAAIDERQQELVRSERLAAVGKMAAIITHEVRNPLSSISLNTELLAEEIARHEGGSEAAGLCRAIQREVDRLTTITEEYLRFARLPRPRLEKEQLNGIVSGIVEFQREELAGRGVSVAQTLAADLPTVSADEGQIRQALLNLVRNAAEAMGDGGALTLTTRRASDGAVEVCVDDTGPGIEAADIPRIFDPFFSTKEGGTGLGLALTQQIVAEHGGRIDVRSRIGEGTTFVLRFPAEG
jgi:two-component system, NtrC family, sensor kinase